MRAGRSSASGFAVIASLGALLLTALSEGNAGEASAQSPSVAGDGTQDVRFDRDVRPLLADRCFPCHGPDAANRKGQLRLDTAQGPQGAYRTRDGARAIEPGSLEGSELWYRLTTDDEGDAMPPADSHKQRLGDAELGILERWIEQGAPYEGFWAFLAPTRPAVPEVANDRWSERPIDRFVLRKLEALGLQPSPRADQRSLIRRLTFDLIGLPPTRDEIRAFLDDDASGAYERLVDRLLADPRHGEHMARYWLDLVRFADTNGLHHDHLREMSPYRDWVIRAWNAGLPYDEFITYQIAGDLFPNPTDDQLIASGFNRLHLIIDRGTMLPEESFTRNVVDRVTAVGTAFMGLTLQCAVCHDHKYDPVRQKDFYQLFAFFNNFDGAPETGGRSGADFRRGLQPPYISFPTREQTARLAALDLELASVQARIDALDSDAAEAGDEQGLRPQLSEELKQVLRERTEVQVTVAAAMVMKERAEVRPAHVLERGAYDRPGELVERDTPSFLPPLVALERIPSRMDLARWLVSREHPLTARVAVNRFWQQLFGVGIVKTSEDFGAQGDWPSHALLLDHLAVSLMESGWDVKALLEEMVLSETYRQSSTATPAAFEADPENRLLARGSRFRMDAEMIRDQILASSGLLQPAMYGPSVKPPQPPGIWSGVTLPDSYPRTYVADRGDKAYRRSLYTFWKRGMPPPQMSILNAPTRESCSARRERTNTPLQALLLMNETEYLKAARNLARTVLADADGSPTEWLDIVYETITSRTPSESVRHTLLETVRDLEAMYAQDPELLEQLDSGDALADGRSAAEVAAWTVLASTVYNLDITKTRE